MREFWSLARLRLHLKVNPRCAATTSASDIVEVAPVGAMTCTHMPVAPLIGPAPWWSTLRPTEVCGTAEVERLGWAETARRSAASPLTKHFFRARHGLALFGSAAEQADFSAFCEAAQGELKFANFVAVSGRHLQEASVVQHGSFAACRNGSAIFCGATEAVQCFSEALARLSEA